MDAASFYRAGLRLGLLDAQELADAGVKLTRHERRLFDQDPLHFFFTECGPTRRQQIFALVNSDRPAFVITDDGLGAASPTLQAAE